MWAGLGIPDSCSVFTRIRGKRLHQERMATDPYSNLRLNGLEMHPGLGIHMRTVWSSEPEAMRLPSGEKNATDLTHFEDGLERGEMHPGLGIQICTVFRRTRGNATAIGENATEITEITSRVARCTSVLASQIRTVWSCETPRQCNCHWEKMQLNIPWMNGPWVWWDCASVLASEIRTSGTRRTLKGHSSTVYSVAFLPNGSCIARVRMTRLYESGMPDRGASRHLEVISVISVAFSPDGSRIASGSLTSTVQSGMPRPGCISPRSRAIHMGEISCILSDGSRIASVADDQTVRIWMPRRRCIFKAIQLRLLYGFSCILPDGSRIASDSVENTARIWDAKPAHIYPPSSIILILHYPLSSLQRALILLATDSQLLGLVLMRYSSSRLAGLWYPGTLTPDAGCSRDVLIHTSFIHLTANQW